MQENHWYNTSSARTHLISSNKVCVLRSVSLLLYIRPFSEKRLVCRIHTVQPVLPKKCATTVQHIRFRKNLFFFFLIGMSVDMGRHNQTHSPTIKNLRN